MRWIIRTGAVLSVVSWIVIAGLLARPVVSKSDAKLSVHPKSASSE
jgi:hypothetical protein